MSKVLLEVKNLVTQFKTDEGMFQAIKGISFTLHRGETLGIVGESGSGKSVTSLSIMRLIDAPPGEISEGEIIYHPLEGKPVDLLKLTEKEMRHYRGNELAMIFQEPMTSLNPVFTCGKDSGTGNSSNFYDHVRLLDYYAYGNLKTLAKKITLELFEKVQLPDPSRIFASYPHQLSGGQKQRVMIAMAMSCNPDVLIADEPTTALDVTVQKTILQLMNDLKKSIEASIIFITHDLGVIAEIADRVLVMYKGKIVEQGNTQQIFSHPQHPYTKGLLGCRPPLEQRLKRLPVVADFMEVKGDIITEKNNSFVKSIVGDDETKARLQALTQSKPLLSVRNLNTWFPSKKNIFGKPLSWVKAVNDVSLDVYPGETLGLVGESGCGKTTLGRSILRLIEPTSGSVIYNGKDVVAMDSSELRALRKDMQIIFQDPYSSLNPRMSIGQAILEPMKVHRLHDNDNQRKEKVMQLLKEVGLEEKHFHRYPHEFSGGQRQRVCIARALSVEPKFIICDESVSALDVSVQAQVLNLLLDLRDNYGFSYIFISHDLSVVKFISDRMIVMNKGKIVEVGAADDIYNQPKDPYTLQLIDAIPKGEIGKMTVK